MPQNIKSPKQFRFLQAAANNALSKSVGPTPGVAKKMLSDESESRKKKFAKATRVGSPKMPKVTY